jgi:hypothetical protein
MKGGIAMCSCRCPCAWFELMLTDQQIAVLRDLGSAASFDHAKKDVVIDLLARGYLEREGDLFKLTAMGLKELLNQRRA